MLKMRTRGYLINLISLRNFIKSYIKSYIKAIIGRCSTKIIVLQNATLHTVAAFP